MGQGKPGADAGTGQTRILVENGEYWLRNRGDIAMMEITVRRLREHWPRARVGLLTEAPRILRALVPEAEPVPASGAWGGETAETSWDRALAPMALRWRAATDGPKTALRGIRNSVRGGGESPAPPQPAVPAAAGAADLVLAQGGGYLTDIDLYQAHRALNLLEYAQAQGVPTAMIGQGLGPIDDPGLLEHAARVLPGVGFIGLREGRRGPDLLTKLGVAPERILVTGDDAIEPAYLLRRPEIGGDLGICLRVAYYARVSDAARATLGEVVRARAAGFDAALAPLVISEYDGEDRQCTRSLLTGAARARAPIGRGGSATAVIRQVSGCRVVVTSAYHLAVFALAQGIPAIGLTASRYYDDKFHGLAEIFGGGMRVVRLDAPELGRSLDDAIRELWESAPDLRKSLLHRAQQQTAAARTGMDRVYGLVEGDRAREER
ncbi:polysaccharide pyruvyl transferase family protein [Nocardia alni]|uniref:polysaccharide pyruvyl transferase family protein n=1 Tax=Nocardia alni TaxID=2815723 RepID=UPI0027E00025|nr:polysaccharide pyruvyl transferase family protein [Nocardia alni]